MSIRKKLASFMLLMTGLLVLVGGLLIVSGPIIIGSFRQSLVSMNDLDQIRQLKSLVGRQRSALNQYLLVDDPQELLNFQEAMRGAQQQIKSLSEANNQADTRWVKDLAKLFQEADLAAQRVMGHYKKGNKVMAFDEAASIFGNLSDTIAALEKEKSAESQALFERIASLTRRVESMVFVALLMAGLFGLILFQSLYKSVMKPLEILKKGTEEFGKGHWDFRINLPSSNEFGSLAVSFNNMAENVKQLQLQAIHMDRMSAVGQLAGGVAHEINNPLTAVLGQAQILMARMSETDSSYSQVQKIEQAALRCKKIVRGLLDFSRPSQTTFEQMDLAGVISATLDLCEADLKRSRVVVEKKWSRTPLVEGNPSELQQVLLNLINNAIQAMPRGGTLAMDMRAGNEPFNFTDRKTGRPRTIRGQWVEITVKDTGVGIAKEHLTRVFEPFFTTKEIGKGTGLGLAVSIGIVQKHGGDLRVESGGLNRGSTFTITLPVKRPNVQPDDESKRGLAA